MKINEEAKTTVTILRHQRMVACHLDRLGSALKNRGLAHDLSKLALDEFGGFVEVNRIAREHHYGSEEYKASLEGCGVIPLHFSRNPHHPEYHEDGIHSMSLIDIIEMVADWKAACETYGNTNLKDALSIQVERFGLQEGHLYLIGLILDELERLAHL